MSTRHKRPNILIFFSDQQRWDTCGCYGQKLPVTPNLDRLAEEGARFESAFTCQPVCGPARACLQTGKYPTEVGCFTNNRQLPPEEMTLAKWLNEAGYQTGYIGKWHLASCGGEDDPNNFRTKPVPERLRGGYKDYWVASDVLEFTSHSYDGHMFDAAGNKVEFPEGRYRVDAVTDHVVDFLETRPDQEPWYLMASYIEPHHQNDHNRYEGPHGSKEKWADCDVPGDLVDTEGDWRENYPDYLGCCHALDRALGRVRDTLEARGMAEDTIILYFSDHGSHFRTRNSEYKRACHDGCIRVPLVAHGPGFDGVGVRPELVSLIDVPPTVLRAAGVPVPATMHGRPLQEAAAGARDWKDNVFVQVSESHVGRAVRTHRWKYSVRAPEKNGVADPGSDVYVEDFLYDLEADPHERNNLVDAAECTAVRAEMATLLKKRMLAANEAEPEIRSVPDPQ